MTDRVEDAAEKLSETSLEVVYRLPSSIVTEKGTGVHWTGSDLCPSLASLVTAHTLY
jgi:hypothetical protein